MNSYTGNIQTETLQGHITSKVQLQGIASIGKSTTHEIYNGEYEVIPKNEAQTLKTAQKLLMNNVEVTAIPYAEVSNEANGKTVTIG